MTIEFEHVREEMRLMHTEELVEILAVRDEDEWRPEVFPIIEEVLRERGVSVADEVARLREALEQVPRGRLDEASEDQLVVVAELESSEEAELCRLSLAQAGVQSLTGEPGRHGGGSVTWDLRVEKADLEAARQVLAAAEVPSDAAEADDGTFKCPSCGFVAEPMREEGRLVCQVCGAPQ